MTKPQPIGEDELKALVQGELRQAVGFFGGKLAEQRRKAEIYYYAEAKGDLSPPDIEGRSAVVVPRVRNTILAILPPLMVKFCGGDKVVEFEATKPGEEAAADKATDYCNYVFFKQNNGHAICRAWFTDALKFKNGIIKVWWDERRDETREEYRGLTQIELSQIADDPEVEITEQASYPDEEDAEQRQKAIEQLTAQCQQAEQVAQQGNPQAAQACEQMQAQIAQIQSQPAAVLYDIVCKRTKDGGKITIENVPPEEFGISRDAKTIREARFVRHSVLRTLSELRTMGYPGDKLESIGSDESGESFNMERVERLQYDDESAAIGTGAEAVDPSQRRVWVHECYIRVDADGDGIAELRKVTLAGNQLLDDEIVDVAPFVSICPVPEPHKFFGLSITDLAMTGQFVETELLRGVIDNNRIQLNGRFYAVDGQVNLDDLLMSRPGGVVRVKNNQAVGRLEQGMGDVASAMNLLGYMENFNADATGYSNQSQSFDTEALDGSETATKTRIVSNKASMRTDDVARNFAEGFVELFRMILKLSCQRQNKAQTIRLSGKWVDMDPREWRNQFDVSITVGLGVGDKDQQVSHLNLVMQTQAHTMPLGVSTPQNIYNAAQELEKALGYKGGKFFTPPDPNHPPPNPMQGQMRIEQMKAQLQAQTAQATKQAELELERQRMQMQAQVDTHRQQVEAQQQAARMQMEKEMEQFKAQVQMQLDRERAALQSQTQITIAQINAESKIASAEVTAKSTLTAQQDQAADDAVTE